MKERRREGRQVREGAKERKKGKKEGKRVKAFWFKVRFHSAKTFGSLSMI